MARLYMEGLRRVPNMSDCGSIRFNKCLNILQYALMSLNMPKHGWILQNFPEYAWINCFDYARVLSIPWYGYNNIIIFVTNVVILEFLSATILSFFKTSWNIRINFSFWLKWRKSFQSIWMNSWVYF